LDKKNCVIYGVWQGPRCGSSRKLRLKCSCTSAAPLGKSGSEKRVHVLLIRHIEELKVVKKLSFAGGEGLGLPRRRRARHDRRNFALLRCRSTVALVFFGDGGSGGDGDGFLFVAFVLLSRDDGGDEGVEVVVGGDVFDFDGGDSELGQVVVEVEVGGHGFDVGGKADEKKIY